MNNLPIEIKKENLFKRFLNFFKSIFRKEINEEVKTIEQENPVPERKTTEAYKVEGTGLYNVQKDNTKTMKEIINIIEKNPKTLEKLDIEKVELIEQYYVEQVAKYRKILGSIE